MFEYALSIPTDELFRKLKNSLGALYCHRNSSFSWSKQNYSSEQEWHF